MRESNPEPDGQYIIYWLLFVIWATDTGALAIGAWLGGPKLAPDISPKKTWSGAVGGVVVAMVVAGIATPVFFHIPMAAGLLLGAGASVIGQVGDLLESGIKRRFGMKDFGAVIPGHGGAFDRLDSLLLLLPFAAIGNVILMEADLW
jgi:phosphatidate cytidylyltransferase